MKMRLSIKRIVTLQFVILLVVFLTSAAALAQQTETKTNSWQFGVSLYGWFPDIAGNASFTQPGGTGEFKIPIETTLDSLEAGVMGTFDVRKERWGFLTEVIYMDVAGSKNGTREGTLGGSPLPVNAAANVSIGMDAWFWSLAGYYRALEQTGLTLDVLAGGRYIDANMTANWTITGNVGPIPVPGRTGAATVGVNFWDAVVGVRGQFAFGAKKSWFVPFYFDLGAGGSDFTGQAGVGLGYAFRWVEVVGAWRYLYYDMPSDRAIEDLSLNGPTVGVTFRW